jgi:Predicted amidophosphoribosyltransferases
VDALRLLRPPIEALADLLYPPHCVNCGVRQAPDVWLCGRCSKDLPRIRGPRCEVCCRPFDGMLDAFVCPNCQGHALHLDFAIAPMRCAGVVRELIHRFKYGREFHLRRVLGEWLCEALDDRRIADMEAFALVPVPLHPARRRERQFNQSEALAEWASRRRKVPLATPLKRIRHTVTQTQFDRKSRMRNLRGAFALRHNARVKDQSFLLVDDVLTTGSTLDECARVLLEGGARSVRAIIVARG